MPRLPFTHSRFNERQLIIRTESPLATSDLTLDSIQTFDTGIIAPDLFGRMKDARWTVDASELSVTDVEETKANENVLAIAPVMPMHLITPLEGSISDGEISNESVSWGVEAVGAVTSPYSGEGVTIAVLDTGININHPAFKGIELICRDFTSANGGSTVTDTNGHGTHCAGIIFGQDGAYGRIGVARGVKKALIAKVIGDNGGDSEQVVNAIQWAAEQGADIISMSLGINYPGKVEQLTKTLPLQLAVSRALEGYRNNVILFERVATLMRARKILIVAAAGNESQKDKNPEYEVGVSPPAVADGIVSVAALGRSGGNKFDIAPFSNVGSNIAAPGVEIISADAQGGVKKLSGTSMAAPYVAGVAALWIEALRKKGGYNYENLKGKLVGLSDSTVFVSGFDLLDIGSGLAKAPQQ